MNAPITKINEIIAANGSNIQIPILVKNFIDITAVSLTFTYDPVVMDYVSMVGSQYEGLQVSNQIPGTIVIGGFSSNPGITIGESGYDSILLILEFFFKEGQTSLTWATESGACEYAGLNAEILNDIPKEEYYLNGRVISNLINLNLKCWGQVFPISGYGKADGVIKLHIQDAIAPFRLELKINGNFYRSVEDITEAQYNYVTWTDETHTEYADCNCVVGNLPPGAYTARIYDNTPPPEGPQEVRIIANWNAVSPPFATLNGTVNPLGTSTNVYFEYGKNIEYTYEAQYGIVNGNEPVLCSLQLSSGGYNNTSVLIPGTEYHYRIKATNAIGTAYGEDMTFTTPSALPIVVTLPATNITS